MFQSQKFVKDTSAIFLILANLVPLFGVLFLGWQVAFIMFIYWAESGVVGFYNILKLRKVFSSKNPLDDPNLLKKAKFRNQKQKQKFEKFIKKFGMAGMILFFIFHFGMFMYGHGVFIFALFGRPIFSFYQLLAVLLPLFVSHGISYRLNFIGKSEFKKKTFSTQMTEPYKRIIIMHLTIIFGGFVSMFLDLSILALVVMIIIKIIVDLKAHNKEHGV